MTFFNEKKIERFGLFFAFDLESQNFAIFDNFYTTDCKS